MDRQKTETDGGIFSGINVNTPAAQRRAPNGRVAHIQPLGTTLKELPAKRFIALQAVRVSLKDP